MRVEEGITFGDIILFFFLSVIVVGFLFIIYKIFNIKNQEPEYYSIRFIDGTYDKCKVIVKHGCGDMISSCESGNIHECTTNYEVIGYGNG